MDHIGSDMDHTNGKEGNTKTSRSPLAKFWQGTLNNYDKKELDQITEICKKFNYKYLIGFEEAPTTGTKHLHVFIQSESRIRINEKIKNTRIHWEKCNGNADDNINYIVKDCKDPIGNIRVRRQPKILREDQLYPWQVKLYNILKGEPDDRTIYWYWSKAGATGKTTFCKFLSAQLGAVPLEGKKNDILYCAAEFESDIYIYDLERTMAEHVSYGSIEKIKNMLYMCAKYESKPILRACPHVVIFANFPPETSKLSEDRWKIVNID